MNATGGYRGGAQPLRLFYRSCPSKRYRHLCAHKPRKIAMVKDEEDWDSASSSSTEGFRFGIADRVFCHFGGDWWPGKVLKQNYMPEKNIVYPYQVELETYPESSKVYVTHDNDDHIRAFPPGGFDESRLRFQLGSRVQCIMDGGWKPGRIVDLNYTEVLFVKHCQRQLLQLIGMNKYFLLSKVFLQPLHSMKIDFGLVVQRVDLMEFFHQKYQSILTLMLELH